MRSPSRPRSGSRPPRPSRPLEKKSLQRVDDLLLVISRAEVVKRMRRKIVLGAHAATPGVEHGIDVAGRVLLEGRGDGVRWPSVEEALQRKDPVVQDSALLVADEA